MNPIRARALLHSPFAHTRLLERNFSSTYSLTYKLTIRQRPQCNARLEYTATPRWYSTVVPPPLPKWDPYAELNKARKEGLLSRVLYRADGKPRSKLKGLFITTTVLITALLFNESLHLVEEYEAHAWNLTFLVYAQRADHAFIITHWDDLVSSNQEQTLDFSRLPLDLALAYFYAICTCIPNSPPSVLSEFFSAVSAALDVASAEDRENMRILLATFAASVHGEISSLGSRGADSPLLAFSRELEREGVIVGGAFNEFGNKADNGQRKKTPEEEAKERLGGDSAEDAVGTAERVLWVLRGTLTMIGGMAGGGGDDKRKWEGAIAKIVGEEKKPRDGKKEAEYESIG